MTIAVIQTGGTGGIQIADIINLFGLGLILLFLYLHIQYKLASDLEREQEAQKKAIAVLMGFLFYTAIVATYGVYGTWVGQIGIAVNTYFEEFARELFFAESPVREEGVLGTVLAVIKTLGLVAYVLVTGIVTVSLSIPVKIARSIF